MQRLFTIMLAAVGLFILGPANATPLSGTKTIGPTGNYTSLTGALADIQAQTLGGALVLELQANYVSSVESFPLIVPALNGSSEANTVTIRPQADATGLAISSSTTANATLDINAAQNVIFDGRPGGLGSNASTGGGTASQLTIVNTSTSGRALRFINGASNNTFRYVGLRGVNTTSSSAVVIFGTATGDTGNNNNVLDHCDIHAGNSPPANCIYSAGNSAPKDNRGNTVSNCNIYDFMSTLADQYGIRLENGNSAWTISGNQIYQSGFQGNPVGNVGGIYINSSAGNDFTITSNKLSGWTLYGTATATSFIGISLKVGADIPSSVQGNTIYGMYWVTTLNNSTLPGVWGGITVVSGSVNIGTSAGNTIGGASPIGIASSGPGALTTGITSASSNTVVIANNNLSNLSVSGTGATVGHSLTAIQASAGTVIISNNVVGSPSSVNSLEASTAPSSGASLQQVTGICYSGTNACLIANNFVAGLNNKYTNIFSGQVRGIICLGGSNTITDNIIRNLSTTSADSNPDTFASVLGICDSSASSDQVIARNSVFSLANTTGHASVTVNGIWYGGIGGGYALIDRNFVHSLSVFSTNNLSLVNGIHISGGSITVQNNMIRIGLAANGNSTAGAALLYGIHDGGSEAGRYFYHNSVYLGGTQTSGKNFSAALLNTSTGNTRAFENNILVNARTRSSGTSKQYAFVTTATDLSGLTSANNIFLASGVSGVLARYNSTDYATLGAWQATTGQDVASLVADPLYLNPAGTPFSVDLHIATNSPAINAGLALGITNDFDGDIRDGSTPAIGADEVKPVVIASTPSVITDLAIAGNGSVGFGFTNITGASFSVLASTNVALPLNVWTDLGPAVENPAGSGQYQFSAPPAAGNPQMYYRVRSP